MNETPGQSISYEDSIDQFVWKQFKISRDFYKANSHEVQL